MRPRLVEPRIVKHLYAKSADRHIPVSGTFELTPLCNMSCKMCYVRMTKEEMNRSGGRLRTIEEWLELAETAKKEGLIFLLLTGGEPFLYPGFKELYHELSKMGFVLTINSNATMINNETVEWLKKNPPMRINITLYGASDETYNRLCHNPKGFSQVTSAIKLLKEAGISIKLNCSVTPYNIDDLPAMVQFAQKNELIMQASSYMFPPMRRDENMVGKNDRFTAWEAAQTAMEIVRLQNGDENFLTYARGFLEGSTELNTEQDECIEIKSDKIRCSAGRCAFWITWDGRMIPCGMMAFAIGYPFENGFKDSWMEMNTRIENIELPLKCAECSLKKQCGTCAAMVFTETGGFKKSPDYRCEMAHSYYKVCTDMIKELEEKTDEKEQ